MADLKGNAVAIPIMTVSEAKERYLAQFKLLQLYNPTATDEQITTYLSVLASIDECISTFGPVVISGAVMAEPYYLKGEG